MLGFRDFCQANDWHPAFYQTLADHLELYQALGFRLLKIGEEAIIDLGEFTLQGKAGRSLRPAVNKCLRQGYRVQFYQPPLGEALLAELKAISDDWLRYRRQGAEKKFSLGWFDPDYLETSVIAVVEDGQGKALAFANLIPEYQLNEATIDLMRYHHQALPGTMDYLLVSLLQYCQNQGYAYFNLGLVAFADQEGAPHPSRLQRGIRYLYNHLNHLYNFQGLRAYKEKFRPHWQSRYLVYSRRVSLPEVIVALVRVDSGDVLQEYLGAKFFSNALSQWVKGFSRWLPALLSLGLFSLCIWAIIHELQKYQPQVVIAHIQAIPRPTLTLALGLTALNYLFLTGYDILARFFVHHRLPYVKTALVAAISYAISNSVGFALLSGSAIRYRFYAAWGLTLGKLPRLSLFVTSAFGLVC
ncbi:MAG: phosphatidylglycerol lysyltransferase domain-containing protein [Nodosilinea sp. LVE1205-7]